MKTTRHAEPANFAVERGNTGAGGRMGQGDAFFGSFGIDLDRIGFAKGVDRSLLHASINLAERIRATDGGKPFIQNLVGGWKGGMCFATLVVNAGRWPGS